VAAAPRGHLLIPVPFDPDTTWGAKPRHHIRGTVNGQQAITGTNLRHAQNPFIEVSATVAAAQQG
jgi:hypothetical protein